MPKMTHEILIYNKNNEAEIKISMVNASNFVIFNLIFGVNECTASHLTSQNKVFTLYMIGLSQSISKIKTSG